MCYARQYIVNNKESSCATFLYLSQSFDSVNYQISSDKLEHCGVRKVVHSLLKSYLENRKQFVSYKDISSTFLPITSVPRGRKRSGSLFINGLYKRFATLFKVYHHIIC